MKRSFFQVIFIFFTIQAFIFCSYLIVLANDTGCNYPASLEITCINIGQGDATLIASPTKLMLADVGETDWNSHNDAIKIDSVIRQKYGDSCNTIDYILISHMHLDHIGYIKADENENEELLNEDGEILKEGENLLNPIFYGGLAYLVKELGYTVQKTFFRDYITHNPNKPPSEGGTKTYRNWRAYLASPDGKATFNQTTAVLGSSQIDLGSINSIPIIVDIIGIDGTTSSNINGCDPVRYFGDDDIRGDHSNDELPPSENDLSIGFVLSFGNFQMFIGGDTSGENYESEYGYKYHDMESCIAEDPYVLQKYSRHLEILRANHHGSSHSTNQTFIDAFDPKIAIFSVGDNNTYGHVDKDVLDRVLAKVVGENSGRVFMTECGDDVHSPQDACHSLEANLCAEVVDNEFPETTESNEIGDSNLEIVVALDGKAFTVQGDNYKVIKTTRSMPWIPLLLLDE